MAVFISNLVTAECKTTPITTASVTFRKGRLYLLAIARRKVTAASIVNSVAFTGGTGPGTWAQEATSNASNTHRVDIWWVIPTSDVTDTVVITYDASAANGGYWIEEVVGFDPATPFVQQNVNDLSGGSNTSIAVTLSAFGSPTNAVYGIHAHGAQEATTVDAAPAGYAALNNYQSGPVSALSAQSEWNTGEDLSVSQSWGTGSPAAAAAVEIKAGTAPASAGLLGAVTGFGGATPPDGWVLCDGADFPKGGYPDLDAILSAASYPYGSTSSRFNVPDLRGKIPLGKASSGTGSTIGSTGGALDHTHTGPSHTHGVTQPDAHTAHIVTQPSAHTSLAHASEAVAAHPSALTHSGFAFTAEHSIGAEAAAHGTHAAGGTHQHATHPSTANKTTGGAGVGFTATTAHASEPDHTHDAHSTHTGSTVDAHSVTAQATQHSADTHTVSAQPTSHALSHSGATVTGAHTHSGAATTADGTGATSGNNAPFQVAHYMIRVFP